MANELVSIFGAGLGSSVGRSFRLENDSVPRVLDGVRIWFDGTASPVLYQQDGQVNAVAPFDLAEKTDVAITADFNGVQSAPVLVPVVAARPAAFLNGRVVAALTQDGGIHSESKPAARGSSVAVFATGLGALASPVADGAVARSTGPAPAQAPEVMLDGKRLVLDYAGPAPGLVFGVFQINIRIPPDARSGILPLSIRVGDAVSAPGALAVR